MIQKKPRREENLLPLEEVLEDADLDRIDNKEEVLGVAVRDDDEVGILDKNRNLIKKLLVSGELLESWLEDEDLALVLLLSLAIEMVELVLALERRGTLHLPSKKLFERPKLI